MNKVLSFDLLGTSPKVYYRTHDRYHTLIGVGVTLTAFVGVIVLSVYFILTYINNERLNVQTHQTAFDVFDIPLYNKDIAYKLVDETYNEIDSKVITIVPFIHNNNITTGITTHKVMNTTRCDITNRVSTLNAKSNVHGGLSFMNFTCLYRNTLSNSVIHYNNVNRSYSYVSLYITKCMNDSTTNNNNNNHCMSNDEIDMYLIRHKLYLIIIIKDNDIVHASNNPFNKSYSYKQIEIDTSLYYTYYMSFQKVKYKSYKGMFIKNERIYDGFVFDKTNTVNAFNVRDYNAMNLFYPNSIMEIVLKMNMEYAVVYTRTYESVWAVLAQIGGVGSFVVRLGEIVVSALTKGKMFTEIVTIKNRIESRKGIKTFSINVNNNIVHSTINKSICNNNSSLIQTGSIANVNESSHNYAQSFSLVNTSSHNMTQLNMNKDIKRSKSLMGFYKNHKVRNKEEKVITMCDSVCHFMSCGNNTNVSKRKVFIDYCEYIVRKKLSSEELMHKLSELEFIIEYIESNCLLLYNKPSNDNNNNNTETVSKEEATTQTNNNNNNEQKLLLMSNNKHNSNNENSINIIIDDE